MKAQIERTSTYSLTGLDHETMRILDAACAGLVDDVRTGKIGVDKSKLDAIYQLILDVASGCYGDEVYERSGKG